MKFISKLLFATTFAASAFVCPNAFADTDNKSGTYISAGIGTGFGTQVNGTIKGVGFSSDATTTFSGVIGLGYDFGNNWRVQGSYGRLTADVDTVTVRGRVYDVDESGSGSLLGLGVAYDFDINSNWTPYVGVSVSQAWADDAGDSSSGYGFTLGASRDISESVEFFAALSLGLTPEQHIDGVDYNATSELGIGTGIRVRL